MNVIKTMDLSKTIDMIKAKNLNLQKLQKNCLELWREPIRYYRCCRDYKPCD